MMSRVRGVAALACAFASLVATSVVHAGAGWFESGDAQLRLDLQLLNDAEIIRYPISQWPVPRAGLQYAIANAKEHLATSAAVQAALERVRARLEPSAGARFSAALHAGEAGLLRDFDSIAREQGEITGGFDYSSGRFAVGLDVTLVADSDDGQEVRGDGSHLTAQFGNWLLSANTLERWWGPGHDSSLILSNNARPMPTLMVERAEARPFASRWLSWLGPWRFNIALSEMEQHREDIDRPLFMAWRVAIMPLKDMEIGFSRTAQFCGKGLRCTASSFLDLLIGNDNPGFDATPESEPGNQMAGFDLHWASPIGNAPYALYGQYIGEDESGYLPAKYLGQLGLEAWKPFARGGVLQGFVEYANTTCSGMSGGRPRYDCAYTQGKFDVEGYRYRDRVIGHTTDSDAESVALGGTFADARGAVWSATARHARLNHDGVDPRNTVSAVPAEYSALELGWRGRWLGHSLAIELGVEALDPELGDRNTEPYGFIGWRYDFDR